MPPVGTAGVHAARLAKKRKAAARRSHQQAQPAEPLFTGVVSSDALGQPLASTGGEPIVAAEVVSEDKAACGCVIL